jgi:type II secretory pathway component GspD/PulD (secretin)
MKTYLLLFSSFLCMALICGAQEPASNATSAENQPVPDVTTENPITPTEQAPLTLEQILAKPVSANLKNVEVRNLLLLLARKGPLNIVATKAVSGQLTFLLENVTIGDALEIVLITNGLAKEIKGKDIINIMTEAEYQALYGKPYNTRLVVKTYQLQYVLPRRVATFLENIKSKNVSSQIIPDDGTRTLVIIEIQDKIKDMEELIKRLDVPAETLTFELNNANVDEIAAKVEAMKTPNFGDVQVDRRTKRFIVTDHASVLEKITRLIHDFDGKPRQVLIEAKMIQISLSDEFNMGVNWTQIFSQYSSFKDVKLIGNFPLLGGPSHTAQTSNLTTTIGTIPANNYSLVIKALKQLGENKLISAPRLIALADKEATFEVVRDEVKPTTSTTNPTGTGGGTSTQTVTVEFIPIGVMLKVTPSISDDKYITMLIKPEISNLVRYETLSTGDRVPIKEKSTTSTNVMVKDGVTIVIAGLIRDEKETGSTGVPIVSKIPIIGALFSARSAKTLKTETVIFLTPHIITGDADGSVISKKYDFERKEAKELKPVR